MNKLPTAKRVAVVSALVEGMSINSIVRMTGVSKVTILKLLKDLGCACARYHDDHVRGLKPARVQCDEVWSFNFCKAKNVAKTKLRDISYGDVWTWTALDSDSKMIVTYYVGQRSAADADIFMLDLASRVNSHTQLTTDGFPAYPEAVKNAFGSMVDYAQLIKVYKEDRSREAHYSPATCIGCKHETLIGYPDPAHISTSHVERSNLTIRMSMRRFTRLTNGHSKKIENHGHSFSLFVMHYNWCRKHMTLKGKTPAQACGLADKPWTLEQLVGLI
ncbi:MAG TPA: IS1 family transposase [Phycisphaerae bacterium]|nr:IS1 family transposase [Phycisphaerae bacterium]